MAGYVNTGRRLTANAMCLSSCAQAIPAILMVVLPVCKSSAQPACEPQLQRILNGVNAMDGDRFGCVAVPHNDVILVGSDHAHFGRFQCGLVYVEDTRTGAQVASFAPPDPVDGTLFGKRIDISGNIAIIGCSSANGLTNPVGAAYLYDISDPANPAFLAKIVAGDDLAGFTFGCSVATAGSYAAVGAYGADSGTGASTGAVYLFDIHDPTSPQFVARVVPTNASHGAYFGWSLAYRGSRMIVGAIYQHTNHGFQSGAAYLLDMTDPPVPTLVKVIAPETFVPSSFGESVAISDSIVAIGDPLDRDGGLLAGSVSAYDAGSGRRLCRLAPADGIVDEYFGSSVAIQGTLIIVGASGDGENRPYSGSVYGFDGLRGAQLYKIVPDNGESQVQFGSSVAVSHGVLAIGAPYASDQHNFKSGSLYQYNLECHFELASEGTCPGDVVYHATGASPDGFVTFVGGVGAHGHVPEFRSCGGIMLDVGKPFIVYRTVRADLRGTAQLQGRLSPAACGHFRVQALDLTSCGVSNFVTD